MFVDVSMKITSAGFVIAAFFKLPKALELETGEYSPCNHRYWHYPYDLSIYAYNQTQGFNPDYPATFFTGVAMSFWARNIMCRIVPFCSLIVRAFR